jgi:hypothetical protein
VKLGLHIANSTWPEGPPRLAAGPAGTAEIFQREIVPAVAAC